MAYLVVYTDQGEQVAHLQIDPTWSTSTQARKIYGRQNAGPLGWLGRALRDARVIEAGGDPELPSERAMRLASSRRVLDSKDTTEET